MRSLGHTDYDEELWHILPPKEPTYVPKAKTKPKAAS